MNEQRKHKRIKIKDDFLWLIGPDSAELGQIIDISPEGLAFHYIDELEEAEKAFEMVIIFDRMTRLGKVRFATVNDFVVQDEEDEEPVRMRRRGVRFVNLSHTQQALLDEILHKHTG